MNNEKLRDHIIEDLKHIKNDIDAMRILCCGYYAYYVGFDKADRDKLDDCANTVRTKAIECADDLEQQINDGYIITED